MSVTHSMAFHGLFSFILSLVSSSRGTIKSFTVSGHDLGMIYVFFFFSCLSILVGVFGRASYLFPFYFYFIIVAGRGNRLGLGYDEDLYTGASRALRATASIAMYIEQARKKSNLGSGRSGWTAPDNRYHITFVLYT